MNQTTVNYRFLKNLEALPWIEEIWLFGSRARGDNQERSDIDLALICPSATQEDWLKIIEIIENSDTLLKIDFIRFDSLKDVDPIKKNILAHKVVLFKRDNNMTEIFWKDYFLTLGNAIERLKEVLEHPDLGRNTFMRDAALQRFEFVTELFWKVLKKVLTYEKVESNTPRDVLSKAFQFNLIADEQIWLKILTDRNNTSHVYREEDAQEVFSHLQSYLPIYEKTYAFLKEKYSL